MNNLNNDDHEPKNAAYWTRQCRKLTAEVERLTHDERRLNWLADPSNLIGYVQLPTACVEAHSTDMRAAIDAAMVIGDIYGRHRRSDEVTPGPCPALTPNAQVKAAPGTGVEP
jgi:hypothetical protein